MIAMEIKLINITITKDSIGNDIETKNEITVPIIKHEDVYANEFYSAGTIGLKPTLKVRISSLNYNNQTKLKYMNQEYDIIRVDASTLDEISLVCERKISNESG